MVGGPTVWGGYWAGLTGQRLGSSPAREKVGRELQRWFPSVRRAGTPLRWEGVQWRGAVLKSW